MDRAVAYSKFACDLHGRSPALDILLQEKLSRQTARFSSPLGFNDMRFLPRSDWDAVFQHPLTNDDVRRPKSGCNFIDRFLLFPIQPLQEFQVEFNWPAHLCLLFRAQVRLSGLVGVLIGFPALQSFFFLSHLGRAFFHVLPRPPGGRISDFDDLGFHVPLAQLAE